MHANRNTHTHTHHEIGERGAKRVAFDRVLHARRPLHAFSHKRPDHERETGIKDVDQRKNAMELEGHTRWLAIQLH